MKGMAVLPGDPDGVVDGLCYQHPAQKIADDTGVPFIGPHQGAGKPHRPLFLQGFLFRKIVPVSHAGQGKEGGPSETVLLQEGDHVPGRLFRVGDNVLNIAAQGRLHSRLVLLVHPDEIRHHAKDARVLLPLLHDLTDAVPVAVIALSHVP